MTRERPILFSAPMVRAILAGTKTQTRREVKLPHMNPLGCWEVLPWGGPNGGRTRDGKTVPFQNVIGHSRTGEMFGCPYGEPGDLVYARETWAAPHAYDHLPPRLIPQDARIHYAATEDRGGLLWRPSIHMPRWASRITLEITGVRVERLQEISEADAGAEGAEPYRLPVHPAREGLRYVDGYHVLWEQINGPGSWDANPWVWVLEFRRLERKG